MNAKDFFGILLMAMFAVVGLTACSDDDEEGRKVTDYKEYVLTVASEKYRVSFGLMGLITCQKFTL